jgi:DNA-binding HxlR family transcriptional regulator
MPDRTYNQYCGVARALDLVGERWALLVARELTLGGKRFTDLRDGLPGIGTNVLATRLRQLEADGVVAKLRLAPPAATTVYVLTEYGQRLVPAMLALGRWGATSMGPPAETQSVRSEWLAVALKAFFQPEQAFDLAATIELTLPHGTFSLRIHHGTLHVETGPTTEADLRLTTNEEALIGFLSGQGVPTAALDPSGDAALLERLPDVFPVSVGGAHPANVR